MLGMVGMLVKMCRVCGKSSKSDTHINLFEKKNKKHVTYIQMVTGLRLLDLKDAPAFMCFCCQSDLKLVMSFRRLCIKTQKKWQPIIEEDDISSQSEQESPIPSPEQPIPHIYKSTESTYRESEPQQILHVMLKEPHTFISDADEQDHLNTNTYIDIDDRSDGKDMKYDIKSELHKTKLVSTTDSSKVPKIKRKRTIYICELCGKYVHTKYIFERHMRTHTGERPFGCENCTSRFLTASELRSHGLTHSGERPYPCRYCDRKYVSVTGRLKHERMHRNDRPFVCEECGKAFTNTYILKNHMLMHTGERSFRCDICQRSFQRKTHLTTHYRSNTHRQNMQKHQSQSNPVTNSD